MLQRVAIVDVIAVWRLLMIRISGCQSSGSVSCVEGRYSLYCVWWVGNFIHSLCDELSPGVRGGVEHKPDLFAAVQIRDDCVMCMANSNL